MTRTKPRIGPMLRLVLAVGACAGPLAGPILNRRLARGKEDPERVGEKRGHATVARPDGPLIWLHGVGVGEVMALRGLIARLSEARSDLSFLLTSSARSSGEVIAANLPPRTIHQYLPLDLPGPVNAFLDHWRPDLAVWSDQEVWPRLAVTCARHAIPQAYVAARITDASAKARGRFGQAYGDLYRLMAVRHAQDVGTAAHLSTLMADDTAVTVSGSLKAAAAPLADVPALRANLPEDRFIWVVAPGHRTDIAAALDAQAVILRDKDTTPLLIIAPRKMSDVVWIEAACDDRSLSHCKRSDNALPSATTSVFIADSFGELGAWYRAGSAALIGGTFNGVEGHNPWEAVALDCAVLHGPRVQNFAQDFAILGAARAARQIGSADDPDDLVAALFDPAMPQMVDRAKAVRTQAAVGAQRIAADLIALLRV